MADPSLGERRRGRPLVGLIASDPDLKREVCRDLVRHGHRTVAQLSAATGATSADVLRVLTELPDIVEATWRIRLRLGAGGRPEIATELRPVLAEHVRVKSVEQGAWLKQPASAGLGLDARQAAIVAKMDGRTVEDIAVDCLAEGILVLPSQVELLVCALEDAGALANFRRTGSGPRSPDRWFRLLEIPLLHRRLKPGALWFLAGAPVRAALSSPVLGVLALAVGAVALLVVLGRMPLSAAAIVSSPARAVTLYLAAISSLVLHELGHAAALTALGGQVRSVALRLDAFVLPVVVVDVTDAWALPRSSRFKVLVAGVFVNGALVCTAFAWWSVFPAEHLAAQLLAINLFAVVTNLLPFFRTDGYYLISHVLGIHQLRPKAFGAVLGRPVGGVNPPTDPSFRWIAWAYVLGCAAVFLACVGSMVVYLLGGMP